MPTLAQKLAGALPTAISYSGVCFRNVSPRFATTHNILSAYGSFRSGGRFNFKGTFEVLYLACHPHTCLEETTKSTRRSEFEVARALPRAIIGVEVGFSRALDLTHAVQRRRLGLTRAILVETDWERSQGVAGREAITQTIGRLARDAGFEALLVPSAALRTGKNLVIFPDRLLAGSYYRAVNLQGLNP